MVLGFICFPLVGRTSGLFCVLGTPSRDPPSRGGSPGHVCAAVLGGGQGGPLHWEEGEHRRGLCPLCARYLAWASELTLTRARGPRAPGVSPTPAGSQDWEARGAGRPAGPGLSTRPKRRRKESSGLAIAGSARPGSRGEAGLSERKSVADGDGVSSCRLPGPLAGTGQVCHQVVVQGDEAGDQEHQRKASPGREQPSQGQRPRRPARPPRLGARARVQPRSGPAGPTAPPPSTRPVLMQDARPLRVDESGRRFGPRVSGSARSRSAGRGRPRPGGPRALPVRRPRAARCPCGRA